MHKFKLSLRDTHLQYLHKLMTTIEADSLADTVRYMIKRALDDTSRGTVGPQAPEPDSASDTSRVPTGPHKRDDKNTLFTIPIPNIAYDYLDEQDTDIKAVCLKAIRKEYERCKGE